MTKIQNKKNRFFGFRISDFGFTAKDGFSLIEFVIYTALLAIVVMFLFQFLLGALSSESRSRVREEVLSNTIGAINTIDFEIRHGTSIYDPTSDFVSDPGQLSLFTKKDPVAGETDAYVDIFVDSEQRLCVRKEIAGTQCITSDNVVVTSLVFERIELADLTEDGVKTILSIEYNTTDPDRKMPFTLETFTQLRSF
jgi:Tfp pilus assembly protein PilV